MRKQRFEPPSLTRKKILYILAALLFVTYIVTKISIDLSKSLFFNTPDRINFVVYGEYPTFYSIGIKDAGNYSIPFYPDLKTQIPGGYGNYRIGALGKLVQLQKDPTIYLRTFSAITSTFVTYYFTNQEDEVYYGGHNNQASTKPQIKDILFMESNASLYDRLFLLSYINSVQSNSVSSLTHLPYERVKDDTILRTDNFLKKYIGLLYNKTYRDENLNIQILYSKRESYLTAESLFSILNGSGIVVGDIKRVEQSSKKCNVIESKEISSITAKNIASFFGCDLKKGETDVYDILFELGNLEKTWEVN